MKIKYYILVLLSGLLFGLISCSDNENSSSNNEGFLNVDLSVDKQSEITTRSTEAIVDTLTVKIMNGDEEVKNFNSYQDLKESGTLRLAEGLYTVTAQSSGQMGDLSAFPYYEGTESFEIQPNLFTEVKVVCRMQNAKIRLVLAESLLSNIKMDYKITLSVGDVKKGYYSYNFSNDGVSDDWYFAPSETVSLAMEGTTTTGDLFVFEEALNEGVNANDFLTIHMGIKSKATRSLHTDEALGITLLSTKE